MATTEDSLQPRPETSLYSNNTTQSHNISNSHNLTSSTWINHATIINVPPDKNVVQLANELSRTSLNETASPSHTVSSGQSGSSQYQQPEIYGYAGHRRGESVIAEYNLREARYRALDMKSTEGTICELCPVNRRSLKLPEEIPQHIEQYIRSQFLFEYPDWISMWLPSQGCKPGPVPIPRRSVDPGDVGYFDKSGRFEILFSIYLSEEENLRHGYHPPKNFVHYSAGPCEDQWGSLNMGKTSSDRRLRSGDLEICAVEKAGGQGIPVVSLKSPATKDTARGTALILPDAMVRTTIITSAIEEMQSYFNQHAQDWYTFYRAHENKKIRETKNGSLLLVTTCYKAKTWALATFRKKRSPQKQDVRLTLYKLHHDADVYTWEVEGSVLARTGPDQVEMDNGRALDPTQCVAIEVCSLVIRNQIIRGVSTSFHSIMSSISTTSRFSVASTIRRFNPMR